MPTLPNENIVKHVFPTNEHKLYRSLAIPSTTNQYSICIQWIQDWFVEKFKKNFFKSSNINGQHIFEDYRKYSNIEKTKRLKPLYTMTPQINLEYNRDMVDLYNFGKDIYNKGSILDQSFFVDSKHDMYLAATPEQLSMTINFRITVATKAQQVDTYKFMQLAFAVGGSKSFVTDMDIHVPTELIVDMAKDAGCAMTADDISDPVEVCNYLNSHTRYPFTYKFRPITGKYEYFMRWPESYIHTKISDSLSADDGNRKGQLEDDFNIDMTINILFPSIKFFAYFSQNKGLGVSYKDINDESMIYGIYKIPMLKIPERNSKGWEQYITTDFTTDDLSKPMVMDLKELFSGNVVYDMINITNKMYVSPYIFMDIHIYNDEQQIPFSINWDTMILTTTSEYTSKQSYIVIYTDLKYMNDQLINIEKINRDRVVVKDYK